MPEPDIFIVKSNGQRERFSFGKLRDSLKQAGSSEALAGEISTHVEKEVLNGMTTDEIYRHAFALLRKSARPAAARYSLRRAVLELGPTGFPFERYIAELYRHRGFSVLLDQTVVGKCVSHEIDVVAWNAEKLIMVEAKYHHDIAHKSDLKVALYVKARFDDLALGSYRFGEHTRLTEGWLITNTKFTERAIAYAECSGVQLLGWNYPLRETLHDLIEKAQLHPITCLTTFSAGEKKVLLEKGMVLCRSVRAEPERLRALGFDDGLIRRAGEESALVCPAS